MTTMSESRSLAHLPVGSFASVMGLAGLAVAWNIAHRQWGTPVEIGRSITAVAAIVLLVVSVAYVLKWLRHPKAAVAEAKHPVQSAFLPATSIAVLVLSVAVLDWFPVVSAGLWWIGVAIQAVLTVYVVRFWTVTPGVALDHVHPAWFIAAVGNMVVPVAGVAHGPAVINWYFFGIGVIYWLALLPIVLGRLFIGGPMPPRLIPTKAILVAPPAVASLAWVRLGHSWADPVAMILVSVTVFQLLLLASQINVLIKAPFAISSWAYSFPLAAATSALMASAGGEGLDHSWLAAIMLATSSMVIAGLFLRTVLAVYRGEVCQPH